MTVDALAQTLRRTTPPSRVPASTIARLFCTPRSAPLAVGPVKCWPGNRKGCLGEGIGERESSSLPLERNLAAADSRRDSRLAELDPKHAWVSEELCNGGFTFVHCVGDQRSSAAMSGTDGKVDGLLGEVFIAPWMMVTLRW